MLELCAYSYLKIGDRDNAEKVFKKLVYNDYNIPVNANILSFIYIKNLHDPQCATDMLREYEKLKLAVDSRYLLPMPGTGADLKDWSPEWAGKLADGNKVTKSINFKDLNDLIDGSFGLQKENQRDEEETQKREQRAKESSLKKNAFSVPINSNHFFLPLFHRNDVHQYWQSSLIEDNVTNSRKIYVLYPLSADFQIGQTASDQFICRILSSLSPPKPVDYID